MHYLVTGFPGTGKSTVAQELKRRGYTAYDPENMRSYMHIESRIDGRHIKTPEPVPRGWYSTIGAFNWDTKRIAGLLSTPQDDLFICSLAHNQDEFLSLFTHIFVLTLDEILLEQRLRERLGDTIGKTEDELQDILQLHRHFENHLLNQGAIAVNVAPGIPEVVTTILHYCHTD